MKYLIVLLVLIGVFATSSFAVPYSPLDIAEFVGLNDTYALGEEFEIRFEKMTTQPCPSYQISLMKDGVPESKITFGVEPLCATMEYVEPYLFSDEFSRPEFFDTVGTYHVELKIDGTTLLKKIEIVNNVQPDIAEYRFVDFSYHNYFGEPITFILEKTALDQCNSYVAEIIDENGKVVWSQQRVSFCIVAEPPTLQTSQIKLGFEPHNQITLTVYGKYLLKIQIDDNTIEKEFLLRPKPSGLSFDRIVYPVPLIDSPLKQSKSGIPFSETKCNGNLQLTQRHDGNPACVRSETVFELIKRGWVSDIIVAVQSRNIFLEQDATLSYMEKIVPTLDDFKHTLSESYDINNIFSKFGEPHKDIGSGIHIYVYELNDSTEVWIGYVDDIWYVKHVDLDGNVLEELFGKNEDNTPDGLKGVFGSCACHERTKANPDTMERCPQPHITWENSTHYIDNIICEWREK